MKKKIEHILQKALGKKADLEVFVPEREEFGHYSTNAALRLAKKEHKNPLQLAGQIVAKIEKTAPSGFFERIEIAKPGFINFWVSKESILQELASISKQKEKYGRSDIGKKKKIIIEYSSPNVAKPMHVGHLRSTVIGDALANMHEFLGYKVIRWNYVGDWGTQFGKLIAAYKRWGNGVRLEKSPIDELLSLYIRFHKEEEKNPIFGNEGREEFMKLESGNGENKKLWKRFREESMKEFKKIYAVLGVKFDVTLGEAFFEPELKPLVERLYKRKIIRESDGALVASLEEKGLPPALIQKSDESSLYLTRDIASLEYRIQKYKPSEIMYVVSNEQTLHFNQLFALAEKMGLKKTGLTHVKFGLVLGERGKKFSTRSGEAIKLEELLRKSADLARNVAEEKNQKLKAKEKEAIAFAVGIGAVKYNDLKENRLSDICFDWDKMLDFRGDTGPYLQYTYARLKSILRKAPKATSDQRQRAGLKNMYLLESGQELRLIRKLVEFPETVQKAAEGYLPNHLAKYLYELGNAANRYYESTPILKDKDHNRRGARLLLVGAAAAVLKSGLGLLGIETPEKV